MNKCDAAIKVREILRSPSARATPSWLRFNLLRLARYIFRNTESPILITDFDGNMQLTLDLSEHMQSRIFWNGYYNLGIIALLNTLLTKGMNVVDVGANLGEVSMVAARRIGPEGRLLALEPVQRIADALGKNLNSNGLDWVSVIRHGASDHTANVPIYFASSRGRGTSSNIGLGSMYSHDIKQDMNTCEEISIVRIDDIQDIQNLQHVDLIKIDIEGAELACLRGAQMTIMKYRPKIIVEVQQSTSERAGYHQGDILRLLTDFGYTFYRIYNNGQLQSITEGRLLKFQNVLCVPN